MRDYRGFTVELLVPVKVRVLARTPEQAEDEADALLRACAVEDLELRIDDAEILEVLPDDSDATGFSS